MGPNKTTKQVDAQGRRDGDGPSAAERGESAAAGDDTTAGQRRHSFGSGQHGADAGATGTGKDHGARAAAAGGAGDHDAGSEQGGLRQVRSSGSVILRRTGSTATTNRPFDLQSSRSNVSFGTSPVLRTSGSGKSLTSVRTKQTIISRKEYHEDLKPTIVAGLNINLVFTTAVIVFGSSFQFGYNIGVLNQVEQHIRSFYRSTFDARYGAVSEGTIKFTWALTTALFIPGGMVGSFLGGWLADVIGRKRSILFSHLFAFIGAALSCACVAAEAPEMLMLGRIFVGVNSGLGNTIAPMFLSEIAPFNYRGGFGTLHQLLVTGGIFLSSVFGLQHILGTAERWPYLILLEVIPALLSLVILPFVHESPRFLLLVRGNRSAAIASLRFYRRTDDVDSDMEEMDTEDTTAAAAAGGGDGGDAAPAASPSFTLLQLFTAPDLRRPLFVACMLQVIQQFSGINAIFFYSRSIFEDAKIPDDYIPYAVIGTNAVNVVMTVVAVPLMDIAGRRMLLLVPMLVMIVDLAILTTCLLLQEHLPQLHGIAYATIVCIIIYVIGFAVGLGPIPMMIGAELFRQGPRPKAMAAASVVNWVATFVIALAFESVADLTGNYVFTIFIVLMIAFVVFTYFLVPETKNKTFEEIANQFSPGAPLEVEELVEMEYSEAGDELAPEAPDDEHGEHELVTLNFDADRPQQQGDGKADGGLLKDSNATTRV